MKKIGAIRPMRLWQSVLFFLLPGLYALFSQYVLFPSLVRLGISEEYAYNTALLTGFVLLFFATIIALRVELEHGKLAWIVNGILWSLFHIFKWWAVPFMLLRQWMLPFVVQRTRNTTPGILIHFISNGLSVLLSIIPLLTA